MQNKRKQHHVWRHYLESWANERGQLWCQMDGKSFLTTTTKVGHRRDFYTLKEMSEADLRFVAEAIIQRATDPHLQESNRGWVPMFTRVFEIRRAYVAAGQPNPEVDREIAIAINTIEEDCHAAVEAQGVPMLASLRAEDAAFIRNDKERAVDFFQFFALQLMRTPRMLKSLLPELEGFREHPRWADINPAATMGLLRWVFANNIGVSLFARRHLMRITFVKISNGLRFITGDQPIVNTLAFGREEGSEVTATTWYFPLSPRLAIKLANDADNGITETLAASDMEVITYNHMIAHAADRQIYAANRMELVELPNDARRSYR